MIFSRIFLNFNFLKSDRTADLSEGICGKRRENGKSFKEVSSWPALTRHLGMKTTFYVKYLKANIFEFYYNDFSFYKIIQKCILT